MPSRTAAFAFGATMFASSALNNIFVTYYIIYFTQVVQLSASGFFVGQCVFMYGRTVQCAWRLRSFPPTHPPPSPPTVKLLVDLDTHVLLM